MADSIFKRIGDYARGNSKAVDEAEAMVKGSKPTDTITVTHKETPPAGVPARNRDIEKALKDAGG